MEHPLAVTSLSSVANPDPVEEIIVLRFPLGRGLYGGRVFDSTRAPGAEVSGLRR
ncbi:hypothetical protein [Saccharomonospora viridis]|uniref:Uncharacterized protein n=1 Tax=Saccharomonospora viridis TaxID=1852 RepID=A0A837D4F3_9PSEU|nr:hypothetical protein [Saccharomonospora viridis]KHF42422.1 hypothetical protein MINT15_26240 [Saccharomonospora viridis]